MCLGDREPTSGIYVPGGRTGQGHGAFIILEPWLWHQWGNAWGGARPAAGKSGLGAAVQEMGEQGLQMKRKDGASANYRRQASSRERLALPPAAKASAIRTSLEE